MQTVLAQEIRLHMQHIHKILVPFVLLLLLSSCLSSPYYQKEYAIPGNKWTFENQPSFKFEITDTTSLYTLQFLIRHTEAYPVSNIWLMIYTKAPGDSTFERTRIEIPLAEPSGKWLGRGMGEIWEHRMPISNIGDTVMLRKAGMWEIKFGHNMRINPLPEVLQVGLRVEKQTKP